VLEEEYKNTIYRAGSAVNVKLSERDFMIENLAVLEKESKQLQERNWFL
jgi:hypothetical protein